MPAELWVITFPSVFSAFRAEKALKEAGIAADLIPAPRELTGSCEGLATKVAGEDVNRAVVALTAAGVPMVREGVRIERKSIWR